MLRPTGYLRDRFDSRDWPVEELLVGASGTIPRAYSMRDHVREVLDQGNANSCVANAIAQAIRIKWSLAGSVNPPTPARWPIYWWARTAADMTGADNGAFPRMAFEAIREYGYPLEDEMAYQDFGPFDPPTVGVYQNSYDQRNSLEYYRIGEGDDRLDLIKRALYADHPVTIGIAVDNAYNDYDGGIWNFGGRENGRHYVTLTGYDGDDFESVGSYGHRWAVNGFCWLGGATLRRWDLASDPYAITFAKQVSG